MRSVLGLVLPALLLVPACGKSTVVNESSSTTMNYDAEEESESSIGVSFAGDDEAALEAADKLVRNGDYQRAVDAYRRVYENGNRDEDVRAEALFRMGSAQGNPLNPQRDYAAAVDTLERFLGEFPDHRLQYEAREKITGYRLLQAEGGG
jgi:tetratricopeptide (TPR) repeat protein